MASIAVPEVFRYIFGAIATAGDRRKQAVMDWVRILIYVTGTVDQELLAGTDFPHRRGTHAARSGDLLRAVFHPS